MATLLSLPNEIVLNIIEELLPDDIPHFASSCKRMQALSRKSLTSYCEHKKKYPEIKFYGCPKQDNESNLPALLQHMFADQMIAYYPRSMILESPICSMDCAHMFEYNPGTGDNDHSNDGAKKLGSIEKLNSLVHQLDNGITKTKDETTDQRLGAGRVWLYDTSQWSTMLGLLLTTFPNIETLTVRCFSCLIIQVQDLLWNAVERNRGPDHTGPTILTKLKTVIVDNSVPGGVDDAEIFAFFALFPSVERLIGRQVVSPYPLDRNAGWTVSEYLRLWHPSLAVTEISFQDCALTFDYFSQLLRGIMRLKRFTYGYIGSRLGSYFGTDPYRLIDLLLHHSRTTLEYLELKGFGSKPGYPGWGTDYGSLKPFEALKEVRVHAALWTISVMHHDQGYDSQLGCIRCEEYVVFPLVEMLPSCVERVYLEGPLHMRGVDLLLTGLLTAKGRRLGCLKAIVFRGVVSPSALMLRSAKVWMEECAGVGVRLDFEWNKWFSDLIGRR